MNNNKQTTKANGNGCDTPISTTTKFTQGAKQHEAWLADQIKRICQHYSEREDKCGLTNYIEFFMWDLFWKVDLDEDAITKIADQCWEWADYQRCVGWHL
jgi:hypothetical protein